MVTSTSPLSGKNKTNTPSQKFLHIYIESDNSINEFPQLDIGDNKFVQTKGMHYHYLSKILTKWSKHSLYETKEQTEKAYKHNLDSIFAGQIKNKLSKPWMKKIQNINIENNSTPIDGFCLFGSIKDTEEFDNQHKDFIVNKMRKHSVATWASQESTSPLGSQRSIGPLIPKFGTIAVVDPDNGERKIINHSVGPIVTQESIHNLKSRGSIGPIIPKLSTINVVNPDNDDDIDNNIYSSRINSKNEKDLSLQNHHKDGTNLPNTSDNKNFIQSIKIPVVNAKLDQNKLSSPKNTKNLSITNNVSLFPIEMESIQNISEESQEKKSIDTEQMALFEDQDNHKSSLNDSNYISNMLNTDRSDCDNNPPQSFRNHTQGSPPLSSPRSHNDIYLNSSRNYIYNQGCQFIPNNKGDMKQYNIETGQLIKQYLNAHHHPILCIIATSDNNYIFTSDYQGVLKQWNYHSKLLHRDYGRISKEVIWSIHATHNCKYFFIGDRVGNQKQFILEVHGNMQQNSNNQAKDYGEIHKGVIFSITGTSDSKYLFTSDNNGTQQQYDIEKKQLVQSYLKIHDGQIKSIRITHDDKYLFTSNTEGSLKQWSIKKRVQFKDFGKIHDGEILSIAITLDDNFIFTSDSRGYLKKWFVAEANKDISLDKDFGQVHNDLISSIEISKNGQFQFTCDKFGFLKQWNVLNSELFKDHGKVADGFVYKIAITK